jgi:outer membrane cobalamin receptor
MRAALLSAVAVSVLAFAASAHAADAADDASTVEELVVTGRAGSDGQKKIEASYAITVVTQEKIPMPSPPTVADVLTNVPGLWV